LDKRILVLVYDHFYPDYSAGGPVTSLFNLACCLKSKIDVRVLTSAYEFSSRARIETVATDQWTEYNGITVWYASGRSSVKQALHSLKNRGQVTLYLNGIFSFSFFLFPVLLARQLKFSTVAAPRGMLQAGALRNGYIKKRIYLFFLKLSQLMSKTAWHATDPQEKLDLKNWFGGRKMVTQISNIPSSAGYSNGQLSKQAGRADLVYFSLISEKKNLLFLIRLLNEPRLKNVRLHIVGPVKDLDYWKTCSREIGKLSIPDQVIYHGEVAPSKVFETLSRYHALALPTQGENFGHAIVEMLSVSRPVIISDKTPWSDVEKAGAGYAIPLTNEMWLATLEKVLDWDEIDFSKACKGALAYFKEKFQADDLPDYYLKMFTSPE
jgi:glycosyltransferase involved in cell wall biosynthesis